MAVSWRTAFLFFTLFSGLSLSDPQLAFSSPNASDPNDQNRIVNAGEALNISCESTIADLENANDARDLSILRVSLLHQRYESVDRLPESHLPTSQQMGANLSLSTAGQLSFTDHANGYK